MGIFAEQCVAKYGFTREEQDEFAIASTERALKPPIPTAASRGRSRR